MKDIQTTGGTLYGKDYERILDTISDVFNCSHDAITNVEPLQKGLSNVVLKFNYNGGTYVFRHPGLGSDILIDRGRESIIQKQIEEAGVDKTLIAMDVTEGWRIARFVKSRVFNYHDLNDVVRAMLLLRDLHKVKPKVRWNYDIMARCEFFKSKIPADFYGDKIEKFKNFYQIKERVEAFYELTKKDGVSRCLTQGDCRDENFLINDEEIYLIDWEYAGYGDPGFDLGTYICGGVHTEEEVDRVLFIYLGKKPTEEQLRHYYAYIALSGYHYMHWTMYKESCGQEIGYLKDNWYDYADKYSAKAYDLYFKK